MAETAAHLVDRVLPEVPVRQWVLTLPYLLRYRCAWDARLTTEVLRAFLRALFADQRRRARRVHGIRRGHCGSVTFIQRFGSALNLTPHFHTLVLDGVYAGPTHELGSFLPLPPPETEDVARVLAGAARRILRVLERRDLEADDDPLTSDDPLLALLNAASIRSRIATGPETGRPWQRLGDRVEPIETGDGGIDPETGSPLRCVRHGGMSLHADVAVPGRDRRRLERLCRYVARPPLSLDRLETMADGRLAYRLKTRWRDGTTHVVMERSELLERLAPLIPPLRAHQVRYHGVLAPCASGRDRVVPSGARRLDDRIGSNGRPGVSSMIQKNSLTQLNPAIEAFDHLDGALLDPTVEPFVVYRDEESARLQPLPLSTGGTEPIPQHRIQWAELLQRVFEVDALRCPKCGERMRVLSAITDSIVASRILRCLALPPRAPPLAAASDVARGSGPAGDAMFSEASAIDFNQSFQTEDWENSA